MAMTAMDSFFENIGPYIPLAQESRCSSSEDTERTVQSSNELFRNIIYQTYGSSRVNAFCAKNGYDLVAMNVNGHAMNKNDIVRIMLGLSELKVDDVLQILRNARMIDRLGVPLLNITSDDSDSEGDFEGIDDLLLKRLLIEHDELFKVLTGAESLNDLDAAHFQAILKLLSPIANVPSVLGIEATSPITANPASFGASLSYNSDLFGMLSGKTSMANERAQLFNQVAALPGDTDEERWEGYTELLAKEIAYKEMEEGTIIPAPMFEGCDQPRFYKVAKRCAAGTGMVAYLLTPATPDMKELPPFVLFRGSVFFPSGLDAFSTYVTDLEPILAERAFEGGKEQLFAELDRNGFFDEQNIQIAGHSLGGALAEHFVWECAQRQLNHPGSLNNLATINMSLFNSPGIGYGKANEFREILDRIEGFKIEGKLYKTKGDIVDLAGGAHIGYGCDREKAHFEVLLLSDNGSSLSLALAHIANFFSESRDSAEITRITGGPELEIELGNRTIKASLVEFMRLTIGLITYLLLLAPYFLTRCLWGWRGAKIKPTEDLEFLQSRFNNDFDQLSNLLGKEISEEAITRGREWLEDKIKGYLDDCLAHIKDAREKQRIRLAMVEEMQQLPREFMLNMLLFNAENLKLKAGLRDEDFPVLAEVCTNALEAVLLADQQT
jgi:hypothetical protein